MENQHLSIVNQLFLWRIHRYFSHLVLLEAEDVARPVAWPWCSDSHRPGIQPFRASSFRRPLTLLPVGFPRCRCEKWSSKNSAALCSSASTSPSAARCRPKRPATKHERFDVKGWEQYTGLSCTRGKKCSGRMIECYFVDIYIYIFIYLFIY